METKEQFSTLVVRKDIQQRLKNLSEKTGKKIYSLVGDALLEFLKKKEGKNNGST